MEEEITEVRDIVYKEMKTRFEASLDDLKDILDLNRNADVAKAAKIPESVVSELKGGSITLKKLIRLSIGTGFDVVELLGGVYLERKNAEITKMLLEVMHSNSSDAKSHVFGAVYWAHKNLLKKDLQPLLTSETGS